MNAPHSVALALAMALLSSVSAAEPAAPAHQNAGHYERIKVHGAALEGNLELQVEVTPERWRELRLKVGDTAYVSPRRARVFLPDYAI